jgi:hypothetical protein
MTKQNRKYIFLGASIRGRNPDEAKRTAEMVKKVCAVLDHLNFDYDADLLNNADINRKDFTKFKPPTRYMEMSDALIKSVSALRPNNDPEAIRHDIACHRWSIDLIKKASACIWILARSNLGTGYEIATALSLEKHCLVLYDMDTISSMISGSTSRLLTVKKWSRDYEQVVEKFLTKAQGAFDKVLRFNVSQEMEKWIEHGVRRHEFDSSSEYLRHLVEKDREESKEKGE